MKNLNASKDKSEVYRTFSLNKITSPNEVKGEPRATKTVAKADLRGGKR